MTASILNIGSMNTDHVYRVDHIVKPGETLSCGDYSRHAGGKGFNQSVALARAGAPVIHVSTVGPDGLWLKDYLKNEGIDISGVAESSQPGGHAIIQVEKSGGQNSIVVFPGTNHALSIDQIRQGINQRLPEDWLLLQNETNLVIESIQIASTRGLRIAFNPSPLCPEMINYPLHLIDHLILNEIEGAELSGQSEPMKIAQSLREKYPQTAVTLTLGEEGVIHASREGTLHLPAQKTRAVDTTAAGDCFTGYFVAALARGINPHESLQRAIQAAAICVSKPGAAESIPRV